MRQVNADARLRVLQVLGNAIVGGMETYVERLVIHLLSSDVEVRCVCPFESALNARLRARGVEVFVTQMGDNPAWHSLQQVAALIRTERVGVVHCHLGNAHLLGGLAGRLTGTPVLATLHGRAISSLDLEVQCLTGSALTVVCEAARLHALALGVPPDALHLVPNGVDGALFDSSARQGSLHELLDLAPHTPLVGLVGRLSPEKGPEVFLRAAVAAIAAGSDAHFVLVGEGPLRAPLMDAVAQGAGAGRVHFVGLRQDMPEVYASLALLVSSSHQEGMPLAVLEAMAAGLPVIATQAGGTGELVVHGETGYVVPCGQEHALVAALNTLLGDAELRARFGAAARRRALEHYAFEASARRMEQLLRALATRAPLARVGVRASS